ncbi:ATP-dependent DNA helicase [Schizosaccharomyces japonicus yFS275]|uniref:ATP-dependent DNA helicase n=1 Tax=Schizosaccharomyces japonicus (strain yFS275 / FY16936) TaxID=402676 RepID=B6JVR0_SCHJY|nr:ATP-dependent DNA helicase [Schizosaccharomyces japonicus yFS275]EEB05461.2 ATP-dependent DNA helicase [Schizosaccharomyces japonicus yFS275]
MAAEIRHHLANASSSRKNTLRYNDNALSQQIPEEFSRKRERNQDESHLFSHPSSSLERTKFPRYSSSIEDIDVIDLASEEDDAEDILRTWQADSSPPMRSKPVSMEQEVICSSPEVGSRAFGESSLPSSITSPSDHGFVAATSANSPSPLLRDEPGQGDAAEEKKDTVPLRLNDNISTTTAQPLFISDTPRKTDSNFQLSSIVDEMKDRVQNNKSPGVRASSLNNVSPNLHAIDEASAIVISDSDESDGQDWRDEFEMETHSAPEILSHRTLPSPQVQQKPLVLNQLPASFQPQDSNSFYYYKSVHAPESVNQNFISGNGTADNPISLSDEDENEIENVGNYIQYLHDYTWQTDNKQQPMSEEEYLRLMPSYASARVKTQYPTDFGGAVNEQLKKDLENLFNGLEEQPISDPASRVGTPHGLVPTLMEHQKEGFMWMKKMEESPKLGGILADDMGLGKTVQTLALLVANVSEDPKYKTNLIVAPVALLRQWEKEIRTKVAPEMGFRTYIHHGLLKKHKSFEELRNYDVVLTTYNTIAYEYKTHQAILEANEEGSTMIHEAQLPILYGDWYRVILDEAQMIKNRNTLTAKGCCLIESKYRWCLSGTPMQNSIDEFHSLLKFLRIKPYCDWEIFCRDISVPLKHEVGSSDTRAMNRLRALIKAVLLRRTKNTKIDGKPILTLPKKTLNVQEAALSPPEKEFYSALQTGAQIQMRKFMKEGTVVSHYGSILVLLLRLRQACCHPWLVVAREATADDNDGFRREKLALFKQLPKSVVEGIKQLESYQCPECLDSVMDIQILIPCGHLICRECLAKHADKMNAGENGDLLSMFPKCSICLEYINTDNVLSVELFRSFAGCSSLMTSNNTFDLKNVSSILPSSFTNILENREIGMSIFTNPTQWVTSTKIEKALEIINDIHKKHPSDKVLLFSQFVPFLELFMVPLTQKGLKFIAYNGGMNAAQRNDALTAFETDPDAIVLLISLKAGNVGLNLTCANHVIVLDPFWNPFVEDQAIDRAHRIGQTKDITVHRVIVGETIEERVVALQNKKRELINGAMGEEGLRNISRLNTKELAFLFGMDQSPNQSI